MDRVSGATRSYGSHVGRPAGRRNVRTEKGEEIFKRLEAKEETVPGREAGEQSGAGRNGEKESDRQQRQEKGREDWDQETKQEQAAVQQSVQDWLERRQKAREEQEARGNDIISKLQAQADAIKEAFDPKNKKNLYDATMDLTLVEQIEKVAPLKAMQSRLMFKIRMVKSSGAKASEIRIAVNKLKKVLGKVKAKVKNLQKEEQLEQRRKLAEEAKRKTKQEALRREKELRKKIRKAKERRDIEESKMGLGANYGGPSEGDQTGLSMDGLGENMPLDPGGRIDIAVGDMAAADTGAADVGGAVDLGL